MVLYYFPACNKACFWVPISASVFESSPPAHSTSWQMQPVLGRQAGTNMQVNFCTVQKWLFVTYIHSDRKLKMSCWVSPDVKMFIWAIKKLFETGGQLLGQSWAGFSTADGFTSLSLGISLITGIWPRATCATQGSPSDINRPGCHVEHHHWVAGYDRRVHS